MMYILCANKFILLCIESNLFSNVKEIHRLVGLCRLFVLLKLSLLTFSGENALQFLSSAYSLLLLCPEASPIAPLSASPPRGKCKCDRGSCVSLVVGCRTAGHLAACVQVHRTLETGLSSKTNKGEYVQLAGEGLCVGLERLLFSKQ